MRRCAVCGIVKSKDEFGDGVDCPKTTCLACFRIAKAKARMEKARAEKESSKKDSKGISTNPIDEFVQELRRKKQKRRVKKNEK